MDLHLQLEMPLEALVLGHPAAAAGSFGACLAVLAAAIGLWRIRSAAVTSRPDEPPRLPHPADERHQLQRPPLAPQPQSEARKASQSEAPPLTHVSVSDEGPRVGSPQKGTLFEARGCYALEDGDEGHHRGGGGAVEGEGCHLREDDREQQQKAWAGGVGVVYGGRGAGWGERWRGDLGWYVHQDVAALNGRVVRLWEDEKRLQAESRLVRRRPWQEVAW